MFPCFGRFGGRNFAGLANSIDGVDWRGSTRRDILWTIDEMRDDRKRSRPIEKFDSIVRTIKRNNDTEVLELFKFAGLNYRNARD
jgi:hypothetical protein